MSSSAADRRNSKADRNARTLSIHKQRSIEGNDEISTQSEVFAWCNAIYQFHMEYIDRVCSVITVARVCHDLFALDETALHNAALSPTHLNLDDVLILLVEGIDILVRSTDQIHSRYPVEVSARAKVAHKNILRNVGIDSPYCGRGRFEGAVV